MRPEDASALVGSSSASTTSRPVSGGEQQRVAIARAIAKNPAVLLCGRTDGRAPTRRPASWFSRSSSTSTRRWGTTTA